MPEELQLPLPFRTLLSELIAFFSLRRVEAYATGGFLRDAPSSASRYTTSMSP